jgi:hypothetical protein
MQLRRNSSRVLAAELGREMAYLTKLLIRVVRVIPLLLLGCGRRESGDASSTQRLDSSTVVKKSATTTEAKPWFSDEREIDLTGDGRADTARLEAVGPTVDSLKIVFTIRSGGNTVYRNSWNSEYALSAISEEGSRAIQRPDSALRVQLRAFLRKLKIESLDRRELQQSWLHKTDDCSEDPRNCIALELLDDSTKKAGFTTGRSLVPLFDTVAVYQIVGDMLAHSVPVVAYSYGSESEARIAWTSAKHRFFTLYECC